MAKLTPEQWAQYYQDCAAELTLYARQMTSDQWAEDLVQEAFFKLLRQRHCPDNVRAWLFRVVRNASVSWLRRLHLRRQFRQQALGQSAPWFDPHPGRLIDAEHVQGLLKDLPANQREVVILRIWGQLSHREISVIIHKPVSSVHRLYQRALATLRNELEQSSCTKTPQ